MYVINYTYILKCFTWMAPWTLSAPRTLPADDIRARAADVIRGRYPRVPRGGSMLDVF